QCAVELLELEAIWSLEKDLPYSIEVRWSQSGSGLCDVLFKKRSLWSVAALSCADYSPATALCRRTESELAAVQGNRSSHAIAPVARVRFPREVTVLGPLSVYSNDPLKPRLAEALVRELHCW